MEFVVVNITTDLERNPEDREDTELYPYLVKAIRNAESAQFVVDSDTGDSWPADEFFVMNKVRRFAILEGEVE